MLYFMTAIGDLKTVTVGLQRQNVSDVSTFGQLSTPNELLPRQTEKLNDAEKSKRWPQTTSFVALKLNQLLEIKRHLSSVQLIGFEGHKMNEEISL